MATKVRSLAFVFFLVFLNFSFASFSTNPFLASADNIVSCPNDGSQLSEFHLCGLGDSRIAQVTDPSVLSIQWQKLNDNSCPPAGQDCPNLNGGCNWNTVSTSTSFTLDSDGEYRVLLTYASAPSETFYAKANQTTYSDVVSVIQNISGNGASDGEIEITFTGNSAPYIHQLQDGNGNPLGGLQNSTVFSGLIAGTYQIRTLDGSGTCEYYSTQVVLTEPALLTGQLIQTQAVASCADTGQVTINASGGVAPYQYSLNGGAYVASNTFSNLGVGSYSATVMDANGIIANTNGVSLISTEDIYINTTKSDVNCFGSQDGHISVQASGGTGGYQYELQDGNGAILIPYQNSDAFANLAPGFYTVFVKDPTGCFSSVPFTIDEPTPLLTTVSAQDLTGYQAQDGSITINVSGGTGAYQYAISPNLSSFFTSNTFSGLLAGDYEVIAQDSNGCFMNNVVTVSEPPQLQSTMTLTKALTCIDNAEIQLEVVGGVAPYEYSMNGTVYVQMNGNVAVFPASAPGTYQSTVRDVNGYTVGNTITIYPIEPLNLSLSATNISCAGDLDGSVIVTATGGTGSYQFRLMDMQANVVSGYQTSNTFTDLSYGSYQVEAIDTGSCVALSSSIEVQDAAILVIDNFNVQNNTYYGANDGSISFEVTGGTAPYTFSIGSGAYVPFNGQSITGLEAGDYIITVRDANGCESNAIRTITQPEELVVSLDVGTIVCGVSIDTQVVVSASGGSGVAYFLYAIDSTDPADARIDSTFFNVSPGTHFITVFDASGYTKTTDFEVAEPIGMTVKSQISYDNVNKEATVNLTVTGGVAPYTYQIDGEANDLDGPIISGLTEGAYTFIVQDKNSCSATVTVQIDFTDSENDGVVDRDEDVNGNGNYEDDDTDGDGTPNYKDADDDDDGVPTFDEIDRSNGDKNVIRRKNSSLFLDTDADRIPNHLDDDDDGDGFLTLEEDYNKNGDPQDDDINESGVPDYLEKGINPESVTEIEIEGKVVVFQNSGHTEFIALVWKAIQDSETSIKVYNGRGNLVYANNLEAGTYETELNVANLSRGIYFVYIKNDEMEEVKKVLVK